VVDCSVPRRMCWKTAVQGMRKTMKNLSMTASVMVKTQTRHIPQVSSGATALQGLGRQSGRRRSVKLVPTFVDRGVSHGQRNGSPTAVNLCLPNLDRHLFYSSSSSIDLTRLSAPRSRPTATQKIW